MARRTEKLEELIPELNRLNPQLEVLIKSRGLAEESAREELLMELKQAQLIDVLINNAGMGDVDVFVNTPWKLHRQMIKVNVGAPTHLFWAFYPI